MPAPRKTELTMPQYLGLCAGIAGVAGAMGIGFFDSFSNLTAAAAAHGWTRPYLLPLGIDAPILAFVVLDLVAITLHRTSGTPLPRSSWLHYAAWGLAGFTVWANGAVGSDSLTWRIIYMVQPALWVLGVEALRWFWKRWTIGPVDAAPDHVPFGRWLANPVTAAAVQRRMWMLGERSWARMTLIEDARQYARDIMRAAGKQGREVPELLRGRVRSARLPETVLARIDAALAYPGAAGVEQAVQDWCASVMVLPELVSADLRKAIETTARPSSGEPSATDPEGTPEPTSDTTSERTTEPRRPRTPNYDRRPSPAAVRKMNGDQLAPFVKAWVAQGNNPSIKGVGDHFRVGDTKAKAALIASGLWGDDAAVIQLGASGARS